MNAGGDNAGMMTRVWGPAGWLFLHCVAFGYPQATIDTEEHAHRRRAYRVFFESIGHVLPCKYCRDSYQEYLREHPIDSALDCREDLCRWLYTIHNRVNDKLDVSAVPSFAEVQARYEKYRARCTKSVQQAPAEKGCVRPADGVPKQCLVNVVDRPYGRLGSEAARLMDWRHWVVPTLVVSAVFALLRARRVFR